MSSDDEYAPEDQFERLDIEFADETDHVRFSTQEVPKESITDEMIRSDRERADSWLVWNKGLQQQGFAPTETITPDNVDQLELEYEVPDLDEKPETVTFKGEEPRSNPIIVPTDPPVAYFTEGDYTTRAINARTGDHLWQYKPQMPDEVGGIRGWHRGVAVYGDTVYLALPTVEVVALNRYTGEQRWRKRYFSEFQREEMPNPNRVSVTQAPVAYDGKLFVGQTADFGG